MWTFRRALCWDCVHAILVECVEIRLSEVVVPSCSRRAIGRGLADAISEFCVCMLFHRDELPTFVRKAPRVKKVHTPFWPTYQNSAQSSQLASFRLSKGRRHLDSPQILSASSRPAHGLSCARWVLTRRRTKRPPGRSRNIACLSSSLRTSDISQGLEGGT